MFNDILFYLMAAVAVGAALALVCVGSPLTSALCLLTTIVSMAGLFGLLDAWFLAIVQVLVYGGAVVVLFLFVIMMVNVEDMPHTKVGWTGYVAAGLSFVMVGVILTSLFLNMSLPVPEAAPAVSALAPEGAPFAFVTSVKGFGQLLFTKYMLPFQLTGVLLLIAMLGVIVLSKRMGPDGRILPPAQRK